MKGNKFKKLVAGISAVAIAGSLGLVPVNAEEVPLVNSDGSTALLQDYSRTTVEILEHDDVNTGKFERIATTGTGGASGAGYTFATQDQTENAVVSISFDAKLTLRPRLSLRADKPGTGNRNDDPTSRVFTLAEKDGKGVQVDPYGYITAGAKLGEWAHYEFVVDCLNKQTSFKVYNYVDGKTDYSGDEALVSADNVGFRDKSVNYVTSFDYYSANLSDDINTTSSVCIDNLKVTAEKPDVKVYTITYIVDGVTTSESVAENKLPQMVPATDKTGYLFKGWQVGEDTGNIISTETLKATAVTANVTYTAVYEADSDYIEPMTEVTFGTFPAGNLLAAGADENTAASNLIGVSVKGELGTDLIADPDERVGNVSVKYVIKGFNWKSHDKAPTSDSAEWGYCDSYGRVVANGETGIDFQLKSHPFNYYGQVVATVTYNEKTMSISAPLAYIGNPNANTNNMQILPRGGYYEDFDAYSPDMVGYEAVTSERNTGATDVVTDNWASYGGNIRTLKIADEDGNRFMRLEATGTNSSSFAANQIDAVTNTQVVFDQMVRFHNQDSEILLKSANPVTWNDNATSFTLKFDNSKLNLNGSEIGDATTGEWYRIVITSDVTSGKCYAEVYKEDGSKIGESEVVNFSNAGSVNPTFYMFRLPDRAAGVIDFDKVTIRRASVDSDSMTLSAADTTIAVPEDGAAEATTVLNVSAKTTDGLPAIGRADWSITDETIDGVTVTPSADDSHIATVTVKEGATPGTLPIRVSIGGVVKEIELILSSTQDSVQFTESSASISIPLSETETVVQKYAAQVVDGKGIAIEGKDVTYSLYDSKNAAQITAPEGTTFENGVLTVTSDAKACVIYIRAESTNSANEPISKSIRVDIHGLAFDLGAGEEDDVVGGYTSVSPSTIYDEENGYGIEGTATAGGEASITDPSTDYLSGSFVFKANVEKNKLYTVKLDYSGTAAFENISTDLSGVVRSNKTKGEVTYQSYVHDDGVLDISFTNAQVSSITIEKIEDKTPGAKPNVYSVTDSTGANRGSWAYTLANNVNSYPELSDLVTFTNNGRGGKNLSSYYTGGELWDRVITQIRPGDYVTIGNMGTNGMGSDFKGTFNYYIDACLALGAKVILNSYSPHGAVGDNANGYNSTTHTFDSYRKDSYDVIVREIYEERKDELTGFVEIGKNADAAFNAYVKDYAANGYADENAAAQAIIDCFGDHNHYSEGPLACELMLKGYGDVDGIVAQLVDIIADDLNNTDVGDIEATEFELAGGTASAVVSNTTDAAADITLYVAVYENGVLKSVKLQTKSVAASGSETFEVTNSESGTETKAFIWNGHKPLADAK